MILIGFVIILLPLTQAVPTPHSISGYIFTTGTTQVPLGTAFLVNDTNSSVFVESVTSTPVPFQSGFYSVVLNGEEGDYMYTKAWTYTHYGIANYILSETMEGVNVTLNITRYEQEVIITSPPDNTFETREELFNVSVNITTLGGADGIDCNITLDISNPSIVTYAQSETQLHQVSNIPLGTTREEIWTLNSTATGITNFTAASICENQTYFTSANSYTLYNITIELPAYPYFDSLEVNDYDVSTPDEIHLIPATITTVWCNGTANDPSGFSNIASISGTLYSDSTSPSNPQDNNNNYKDADCSTLNTDINGEFSCEFDVQFFAESDDWYCDVNLTNAQKMSNISNDTTFVNELLAINVNNTEMNFGLLIRGSNTGDVDFVDEIANEGNIEFDILIDTFESDVDDVNAFTCSVGNIPVENIRVSMIPGTNVGSKTFAPGIGTLFLDLNHASQNLFDATSPTTKYLYWGIIAPMGAEGICNGYVRYIAQKS